MVFAWLEIRNLFSLALLSWLRNPQILNISIYPIEDLVFSIVDNLPNWRYFFTLKFLFHLDPKFVVNVCKASGNMPQNCLVMANTLHQQIGRNLTWKGNKTISVWKVRKADWKVRNGVGKEGEEEGIFHPLHCNVRYSRIPGKEQYSRAHYSQHITVKQTKEYSTLQSVGYRIQYSTVSRLQNTVQYSRVSVWHHSTVQYCRVSTEDYRIQ